MKRPSLRRLFRLDRFGRRLDESLDEEVRFHLETREEQHRRAGMSEDEAAAEARRSFGDPERVRAQCREIDRRGVSRRARVEAWADALQDVRFVLRGLAKARGFTFVALLSLAVGIGVNTAAFTAIYAIWFAPVPGVTDQDGVLEVVAVDHGAEMSRWTYPDFEAVRAAVTPIASLAGWVERDVTVGAQEGGRRVRTAYTTVDYFRVLGVVPALGRNFLESEGVGAGQHPVVVLGHDLWQEQFDGDPGVIGRSISLNREPYTVIGVAPEGFRGSRPTLGSTHLWVPLAQHPFLVEDSDYLRDRETPWIGVLARLVGAATMEEVEPAVRTVFSRLASEYPETNEDRTAKVASYGRFPAQNRIWDMLAVGVLVALLVVVLLIICANLAGMAMARSAAREQEIAVRLALGSGRIRLVRYLMLEALLLALIGGGAGITVAVVAMGTVSPATFGIVAPGVGFEITPSIVAASFGLTFAAALAFGLLPALRFSRPELLSSLKDDAGGGGRRVGRIQRFAASAQVGVALLGLVMGGLFLRSLGVLEETDLGFEPEGMVITDSRAGFMSSALMDLSEEGYATLESGGGAFLDRLSEALASLPGVTAVAFADGVPLDLNGARMSVSRADLPDEEGGRVSAEYTRATEGYLDAIGATLLRGRGLERSDDGASEPVVLITESLAELLWPGQEAVGQQISQTLWREEPRAATVVGVVADVAASRASEHWPHVFIPMRQDYRARLMIVLRAEADLAALAGPVRSALRSVDAALPVPRVVSAESIVERSTQDQRGAATMGGGLGLMVLLLSAIGVYGVVAMTVANRTREIGLRIAMGASRDQVLRAVLLDAVRLAAPGLAVGGLAALGTAAAMRSMLLGVSPLDPISFLGAAGVLIAVVLMASVVPARRASGVDPMEALRVE